MTAEIQIPEELNISDDAIEEIGLQLTESSQLSELIASYKRLPGYVKVLLTIIVILLVIILLASVINEYVGNPSYSNSPGISTSSDPSGLKAYSLLLNSYDIKTVSLNSSPQNSNILPDSTIILDSQLNPTSTNEAAFIYNFISKGGKLILCTEGGTNQTLNQILAYNTVGINRSGIAHGNQPISSAMPTLLAKRLLPDVQRVNFGSNALALISVYPFKPILANQGFFAGAYLNIGSGYLVVLADFSPISNQFISSADNASMGIDLARSKANTVYFDDADALNIQQSSFVMPSRFTNAIYIALIIGLLYILSKIFRLGPPVKSSILETNPRLKHVDALTAKILKSNSRDELIRELNDELNIKLDRLRIINATFRDFDKITLSKIIRLAGNINYSDTYLIELTDALALINAYLKNFRSDY